MDDEGEGNHANPFVPPEAQRRHDKLADELEHPPSAREIRYYEPELLEKVASPQMLRREGSRFYGPPDDIPAREIAFVELEGTGVPSHTELLADLWEIYECDNELPSDDLVDSVGIFNVGDYKAQFGSVEDAWEATKKNLDSSVLQLPENQPFDREELRHAMEEFIEEYDEVSYGLMREHGPSPVLFEVEFGSWEETLDVLEVPEEKQQSDSEKMSILNEVFRLSYLLSRPPRRADMDAFGSINSEEALEKVGVYPWWSLLREAGVVESEN